MRQILPHIIGTAGHIDHGKTELIKALTDIDTDRLAEEKRRGMTIELGFAYLDIPHAGIEHRIGIIDVPGHMKFIKTMVQGASSIDFLMMVIDSAKGIQEQTMEHANIAKLLGIGNGVIVLTKIDKVDYDTLEQRISESRELILKYPFFSDRIFTVDSISRRGMDELKSYIFHQILDTPHSLPEYPTRIDIDRVFSLKGHGIIVTGTCSSGSICRNDEILVLNSKKKAVVKNIQIHNEDQKAVRAGQRAALNLKGISSDDIKRGYTLSKEGHIADAPVIYCSIKLFEREKDFCKPKPVKFLYKTRELRAVLCLSGINSGFGRVRLNSPVFTCFRDRFIIRDISNQNTLGGGSVLLFSDRLISMNKAEFITLLKTIESGNLKDGFLAYLKTSPYYFSSKDMGKLFSLGKKEVNTLISSSDEIVFFGEDTILHRDKINSIYESIREICRNLKGDSYLLSAIKALLHNYGYPAAFIELSLKYLHKFGYIHLSKDKLYFEDDHSSKSHRTQQEILKLFSADNIFIDLRDYFRSMNIPDELHGDFIKSLKKSEQIIFIDERLIVKKEVLSLIRDKLVDYLKRNKNIRVTEFKDLLNITRKYAIPLLEYFDNSSITYRINDLRYLNKRMLK